MCSNGTRVYVHKNIAERFLNRLVEKTKNMKIGNPFDEDTWLVLQLVHSRQKKCSVTLILPRKRFVFSFYVLCIPISLAVILSLFSLKTTHRNSFDF